MQMNSKGNWMILRSVLVQEIGSQQTEGEIVISFSLATPCQPTNLLACGAPSRGALVLVPQLTATVFLNISTFPVCGVYSIPIRL